MIVDPASAEKASPLVRRQKQLIVLAWVVTMLPLAVFGYFSWQSVELHEKLAAERAEVERLLSERTTVSDDLVKARAERERLQKEIANARKELELQTDSARRYRNLAGVHIRFYREADRKVVEAALQKLGFRIETELGSSQLLNRAPDTIAYGSNVSEADLQDIAVALVEAGFPLRRMTQAERQPDPNLIQIIASVRADQCGPLDVQEIRAGKKCG
jgi:hypothetical protein